MSRHGDPTESARARVEQARERLGETVEELAAKTDVKARARERAAHAKARAGRTAHQVQDTASRTVHLVQDKTLEPVRSAAVKAAGTGRRHPGPLIAAAGLGGAALGAAAALKAAHRTRGKAARRAVRRARVRGGPGKFW
jgi:hypothetical protein